MATYDFSQLSLHDFEVVTRDLLQTEWGRDVGSFKTSGDPGVDLRCATSGDPFTIIQCKHDVESSFEELIAQLRDVEAPKVRKLAPRRYVLATSMALTPSNQHAIGRAMQPFTSDLHILGQEDLDRLLLKHAALEANHFKLWLASGNVLDRVWRNAESCEAQSEIKRIIENRRRFVENAGYPRATQLLDTHHVVIVAGIPGIGKTTLADVLLYDHLDRGYVPILIKSNLADAHRQFDPSQKQVFYYNDFLGETFLGDRESFWGRNQGEGLVDFLELIQGSKQARMILTTRAHILNSAMLTSERFAKAASVARKCVLELPDYSFTQKGKILYNHLYFARLPRPYRDQILTDDFFRKIIEHPNFNPRTIETLASYHRVQDIEVAAYQQFVAKLLASPEEIWRIAFERQISNASRSMLLSLWTLQGRTVLRLLHPAWQSLQRQRNLPADDAAFRASLKELEGAFVRIDKQIVEFNNPSIRDFLAGLILQSPEHADDLLNSFEYFIQLSTLWRLSDTNAGSKLRARFKADSNKLSASVSRLLTTPAGETSEDGTTPWEGWANSNLAVRFYDVKQMANELGSGPLERLAQGVAKIMLAEWDKASSHLTDANVELYVANAIAVLQVVDGLSESDSKMRGRMTRAVFALLARHGKATHFVAMRRYLLRGKTPKAPGNHEKFVKTFSDYVVSRLDGEAAACRSAAELANLLGQLKRIGALCDESVRDVIQSYWKDVRRKERDEVSMPAVKGEMRKMGAEEYTEQDVDSIREMFRGLLG